jgi:hypothetical protein
MREVLSPEIADTWRGVEWIHFIKLNDKVCHILYLIMCYLHSFTVLRKRGSEDPDRHHCVLVLLTLGCDASMSDLHFIRVFLLSCLFEDSQYVANCFVMYRPHNVPNYWYTCKQPHLQKSHAKLYKLLRSDLVRCTVG